MLRVTASRVRYTEAMRWAPLVLVMSLACVDGVGDLEPSGDRRACELVDFEIEPQVVSSEGVFGVTSVRVSGGLVYFEHVDPSIRARRIDVVDPATNAKTAYGPTNSERVLLDARDGAVLWAEGDGSDYVIRHSAPNGVRMLGRTRGRADFFPAQSDAEIRLIEGDSAAWWQEDRLFFQAGDATPVVVGSMSLRLTSVVQGGRLAVSSYIDTAPRVLVFDGEGREEGPFGSDARAPVVSDGRLFFVDDRAAVVLDLSTGVTSTIDDGPCSAPSADDGAAVFACETPDSMPAGLLVLEKDGAVRTLPGGDGFHYAPRLDGGRVAWLWYPSSSALCQGDAPGEVRLWTPEAPDSYRTIAEIGAPCLCCGAFWPTPQLAFEGDVLAWTYAKTTRPDPFDFAGYAKIERIEICE